MPTLGIGFFTQIDFLNTNIFENGWILNRRPLISEHLQILKHIGIIQFILREEMAELFLKYFGSRSVVEDTYQFC